MLPPRRRGDSTPDSHNRAPETEFVAEYNVRSGVAPAGLAAGFFVAVVFVVLFADSRFFAAPSSPAVADSHLPD